MKKNEDPIIVEQTYKASIETVWKSITELDLMRQWYFDNIRSFKPEVGFETRFKIASSSGDFTHVWEITEVVPLQKISYNWFYEEYLGMALVTFELFDQGESTKLRLTNRVIDDFKDDILEFKRSSGVAGWEYFIKKRLKEFLQKSK